MIGKYFILLLFVITSFTQAFSQKLSEEEFSQKYMQAENMIENADFQNAILIYKELLKTDDNANLNFKIGFCYLNTVTEKTKSIRYLEKSVSNISTDYDAESYQEKHAPLEAYFYLAQAYHLDYEFEEAIEILSTLKNKLKENKNDDVDFDEQIDLLNKKCKDAEELMKYPVKMTVTNLGGVINTEYDEHSPVFSADESVLIFTSKRKGSVGGKLLDNGQYDEDIYISNNLGQGQWSAPKSISPNINTINNEASIGLSVDGQTLFIYKGNKGNGDIYVSKLDGDVWSKPERLPEPINTKYRETSASLSADGTTLYFTSDRKGGYGGLDIYMVKKLPNGKWGKVMNLGPIINTKYNEEGPFIHPDGVTLFFSSQAHKNMGGYDIFFSTLEDGFSDWSEPTNIGYPINTTADDVFYLPTPDGRRAYYASHQTGGIGGTDIYLISLPKSEVKELTVMTGYVTMGNGKPPKNVTITVTDVDTDEEVGTYTPNSKTGKYLFILKPGKTYNVLVQADNYLYHSENLKVEEGTSYQKIQRAIKLDPIIFGQTKGMYYVRFDDGKSDLKPEIIKEVDNLSNFVKINNGFDVEIVTDKSSGLKTISDERNNKLRDLLVKNGIDKNKISFSNNEKLENNKLKLIVVSSEKELADFANNKNANNNSNNTNSDNYDKNIKQADQAFNKKNYQLARDLYNKALGERANEKYPKDQIALIDKLISQTTESNYTKLDGEVIISYILFPFDKYETNQYNDVLNKLSLYLKDNKDAIVEIRGYTDAQGSNEYNKTLSINRAQFVKNYLIKKGISNGSLVIKGFGEENQIAKDTNPESRKYNRRVEFKLIKEGCCQQVKFEKVKVPANYKK